MSSNSVYVIVFFLARNSRNAPSAIPEGVLMVVLA